MRRIDLWQRNNPSPCQYNGGSSLAHQPGGGFPIGRVANLCLAWPSQRGAMEATEGSGVKLPRSKGDRGSRLVDPDLDLLHFSAPIPVDGLQRVRRRDLGAHPPRVMPHYTLAVEVELLDAARFPMQ